MLMKKVRVNFTVVNKPKLCCCKNQMISTTNDHIVDPPFRIDRGMTQENLEEYISHGSQQPTYALGKYHTKLHTRTR